MQSSILVMVASKSTAVVDRQRQSPLPESEVGSSDSDVTDKKEWATVMARRDATGTGCRCFP